MKKDHFAKHIAAIKREENEIHSMEMLLDAVWDANNKVFVKRTTGGSPSGLPYHWTSFYDRHGNEVTSKQLAAAMRKSRWA